MLYELVHYKHLVLSARAIIFITIPHLGFMLQTFMHSKSIFLGTCVITRVAFQRCFLQLLYETDKVETVDPDCTITHIFSRPSSGTEWSCVPFCLLLVAVARLAIIAATYLLSIVL